MSARVVKCLLIDDDQDDRDIFHLAVSNTKMTVDFESAGDGKEGLDKLAHSDDLPDYIFLDLNMPNMDGKMCLTQIRRDVRYKDLPVIIYSTSSYINDIRDTHRLGANGFITKPSNVNTLVDILTQIFNNKYAFPSSDYYQ